MPLTIYDSPYPDQAHIRWNHQSVKSFLSANRIQALERQKHHESGFVFSWAPIPDYYGYIYLVPNPTISLSVLFAAFNLLNFWHECCDDISDRFTTLPINTYVLFAEEPEFLVGNLANYIHNAKGNVRAG